MESIITFVQAVAVLTAGVLSAICLLSAIKAQAAGSYRVCSQNFEYRPVEAVATHDPRFLPESQPRQRTPSPVSREHVPGRRG